MLEFQFDASYNRYRAEGQKREFTDAGVPAVRPLKFAFCPYRLEHRAMTQYHAVRQG